MKVKSIAKFCFILQLFQLSFCQNYDERLSHTVSTNFPKDELIEDSDGHLSHHGHSSNNHNRRLHIPENLVPNVPTDPVFEKDSEKIVEEIKLESISKKSQTPVSYDDRPNIILIMTDDQDVELGSMDFMPETLRIFKENGIEFRHGYVSTPMCCPSRSSILTGLYVHNTNIFTNNDNCSSISWREKHEKKTFAAHLWNNGYRTSYIGKYLNKYDGSHIPYGWDEWKGLLMNSRFYNYTVNVNGRNVKHGNDYQRDYYPDLILNDTLDFLDRVTNENTEGRKPFLLVSSFPSPHGPEDSSPQYSNMFLNTTAHHTPSYNYAPNTDKQWILRQTNPMTPVLKDFTNLLMTKRLQTLQSVDQSVKSIMEKLKSMGIDEETYIFYTSDHGYHVGQFGLIKGKSMPYEFDIRVPFYLHGPSKTVKRGTRILEPVMNIDLAPTFLDLAGLTVPNEMDGRSILPLLRRYGPSSKDSDEPIAWRDVFLIESSGRRDTKNEDGSSTNKHPKKSRGERIQQLTEDGELSRLENLCNAHPYPCVPGQRKFCRKVGGHKRKDRVHFRKCRAPDYFQDSFSHQSNDPLYQVVNGNNASTSSHEPGGVAKCRCRFPRSAELGESYWEEERRKIDEEIETLKRRIDDLRNRRREMRKKLTNHELHLNSSNSGKRNKGKGHGIQEIGRNSSVLDEKTFQHGEVGGGEEVKQGTTTSPLITTEFWTPSTPSSSSSTTSSSSPIRHEEEDDDEDEEEDDGEEEDEEEDEEDEEDDSKEEEDVEEAPVITTTSTSTTTTTTTTAAPTPETTQTPRRDRYPTRGFGNISFTNERKSRKKWKSDGGFDFDGNIQIESFVKHHNRKHKNRQKNQNRDPKIPVVVEDESPVGLDHQENEEKCDCSNDSRWIKRKEREERRRRKLLSKIRKKQKYTKRIEDPDIRKQAETCGNEFQMNCFWHDHEHWKTAPFWTQGSFCFCMNSNNNTYSCLRSVNATHNYLYCQFVTGFKMYFDLIQDPYQLRNGIGTLLPASKEDWMLGELIRLKKCKGQVGCWGDVDENPQGMQPSIWEQIFARWPRKKKRGHRRKHLKRMDSDRRYPLLDK